MKEQLVKKIDEVARDLMSEHGLRDYQRYERKSMRKIKSAFYPFIIQFGKEHCHIMNPKQFAKNYRKYESVRYKYGQDTDIYQFNFSRCYCGGDRYFLVERDSVKELSVPQAKNVITDLITPTLERWKSKFGPMPKRYKVNVEFVNLTLQELKNILYKDQEEGGTLRKVLKRFHQWVQCSPDHHVRIGYSKRCNEFSFTEIIRDDQKGLEGGIVYHGNPETGYMQNGSVQLEPSYGWAMHT